MRRRALKYVLRIDAGFAQSLDTLEEGADAQKVHLHVEPGLDQACSRARAQA